MFRKFHLHLPHYFSKHPSRNLKELYWSVGLMDLGLAMVMLFEPIFLFTLGYSLRHIVLFYLMVYGGYLVFLPFLGRLVGRWGYEHSIFYSQFFLIGYYIALFSVARFPAMFYIAPFLFAVQKSLYWPAYHADFTVFSSAKQRGREVSGMETLNMILYIVGPFIGGAILEWSNFNSLFVIVAVMFLLSAIPLFRIKEVHSREDFSYGQVFKELTDREHRRNFFAYLGFGEELIALTLWPIFIYLIIKDYFTIGTVVALATLTACFIVLLLGRAADKYKKVRLLRLGSVIYFFSWIIRGLGRKIWHVFGLDMASRLSKEMLFVPLVALTYEKAKKIGVLGYIVFFEQSIAVAKFIAALLLLVIISIFPSPWMAIFTLAGLFSLCYMFIRQND